MTSLDQYDVIVNETFYRCHHILDYIKIKGNLTDLDRSAIRATIMRKLVENGLIDAEKDSLDLDTLSIKESDEGYKYEEVPFVQSIPEEINERMRHKMFSLTGGIPVSLYLYKTPGARRCVYDMNNAVSSVFPVFKTYNVTYKSPTRPGVIASRPFLEVEYNGELYIVDTLLKVMYEAKEFKERYGFDGDIILSSDEMDPLKKAMYVEDMLPENRLADYLAFIHRITNHCENMPSFAQYVYEVERAHELYPEAWEEAKFLQKEMNDWIRRK